MMDEIKDNHDLADAVSGISSDKDQDKVSCKNETSNIAREKEDKKRNDNYKFDTKRTAAMPSISTTMAKFITG